MCNRNNQATEVVLLNIKISLNWVGMKNGFGSCSHLLAFFSGSIAFHICGNDASCVGKKFSMVCNVKFAGKLSISRGEDCPPDRLVNVDNAVSLGIQHVSYQCNYRLSDDPIDSRKGAVIYSGLPRGGKTTCLRALFNCLSETSLYYPVFISLNGGWF